MKKTRAQKSHATVPLSGHTNVSKAVEKNVKIVYVTAENIYWHVKSGSISKVKFGSTSTVKYGSISKVLNLLLF